MDLFELEENIHIVDNVTRKSQEFLLLGFDLRDIFANFSFIDLELDVLVRVHVCKNCQATRTFQDEQEAYKLVFFPHLSVFDLDNAF